MSRKEEFVLNMLYDVADVENGVNYWFFKLLNILLQMFEYENLPKSIPQREIEIQLLLTGHCLIFVKNNELVTTYTNIYDYDKYYNPTKATYAQPILGSGKIIINKYDNEIIYNNSLKNNIMNINSDGSLKTFILRYARQLADIESTINIYTVNNRCTEFPIAKNSKVEKSLRSFFAKLKLGKTEIISDDAIIESFAAAPTNNKNNNDNIINWIDARDRIIECFYRDIGVKFRNTKRAQMNIEEIESDEQVLLISPNDLLKSRKDGIEKINKKFNLNIDIKLNPLFDRKNYNEVEIEKEKIENV